METWRMEAMEVVVQVPVQVLVPYLTVEALDPLEVGDLAWVHTLDLDPWAPLDLLDPWEVSFLDPFQVGLKIHELID